MRRNKKEHVLIAGAGPAGLSAALFLNQRGVPVTVVDQRFGMPSNGFSVVLHPDTLALLDDVGLETGIVESAGRVDTISIYEDVEPRARIDLGQLPKPFSFAAVLPLGHLEGDLLDRLRERKVRVQRHHRLANVSPSGDRLIVDVDELDKDSVGYAVAHLEAAVSRTTRDEPTFVIGADGRNSRLRRLLDIPWQAVGEPGRLVAFEFETSYAVTSEARITVSNGVASSLWPLPGGDARITFRITGADLASGDDLPNAPGRDDLVRMLRRHVPWFESRVGEVFWSTRERFQPFAASRIGAGSAWLLGEAAHLIEPAACQALNLGVRQAHDLASCLTQVLRHRGDAALLDGYERDHRAIAAQASGVEDRYRPGADADPWIADNYRRILPLVPAAGAQLETLVRQIRIERVP